MASTGDKFVYFLVGGFVGASVALLLAPKTGEQAREFLEDTYKTGTEGLTEKFREGREFVTDKSLAMTEQVNERIKSLSNYPGLCLLLSNEYTAQIHLRPSISTLAAV